MALKIKWSKLADRNFDKIIDYLLVEWGEKVAGSFVKTTYDLQKLLSEYPEIGTMENAEKGIRGITIVKQINIFYKIRKDKIIILNFHDNRQHIQKRRI